jgi:hypothetical protein
MRTHLRRTDRVSLLLGLAILLAGRYAIAQDVVTLRNFDSESDRFVWTLDTAVPIDSGFIFGTNQFGDRAKATALSVPDSISEPRLVEVRVWFGYLAGDTTGLTYNIDVYQGTPESGPQTLIARNQYSLSNIAADEDTNSIEGPTVHEFPDGVAVDSSFFVSVSFGDYERDRWGTIGIFSSAEMNGMIQEEWEQLSTNDWEWKNISVAWRDGASGWHMWIEADIATQAPPTTAMENEIPTYLTPIRGYPNPTSGLTNVEYSLGDPAAVRLSLYNQLGQEVRRLTDKHHAPGIHRIRFDARGLPSGTYLMVLDAEYAREVRKLTVIG